MTNYSCTIHEALLKVNAAIENGAINNTNIGAIINNATNSSGATDADGATHISGVTPPNLDGFFYVYALLFVFGCVFNLATLVTLSHSSLRGWSTRVLLAALAVIDSIALLMTFLLVLQEYKIASFTGKKSCKFFA